MSIANVDRKPADGKRWRDVNLARVSFVSGRPDQTSSKTQHAEMADFSRAHNGTPVAELTELGKSAYRNKAARPQLETAIRMIETGKADRLIVWKLDRWIRNVRELARLIDRVEKAGGTFASKSEPWCDTSSPIGYALVIMVGALAEMESDSRRDRALPWHEHRRESGAVPGGPRPYGYVRGRNTLTVDPSEATVIVECATRALAGESLRGIASDLNARGVPTGNGGAWSHTLVKRVVTNPTTAAKRKNGNDGFIDSDVWSPILDTDTWSRCRALLMDPTRRISTHNTLTHFLSGVLMCGAEGCGGVMRGTPHTAGYRYRCNACGQSIAATAVEDYVTEILLAYVDDDAWSELRARGVRADTAATERFTRKLEFARNQWLADEIDDDEWSKVQSAIKAKIATLQEATDLGLPDVASLRDGWAGMDPPAKRTVVATLFESVTVKPGRGKFNGSERVDIRNAKLDEGVTK